MKKVIAVGVSAGLLSGCYTMEHLGNVGGGYGRGDYISSSIMLVLTPLMLVPDVFTMGGLLDNQQTSDIWLGAATQYADHEGSLLNANPGYGYDYGSSQVKPIDGLKPIGQMAREAKPIEGGGGVSKPGLR